jgi:hypothetical protein
MFEKIHNVVTGETTEVPYSKQQIAEVEANKKALAANEAEAAIKATAKAALLSRLGITAEEAALLLS